MLVFMRALPGQDSRVRLADRPAAVTRSTAAADQRRRILRAVGELVAERGYAEVTVELIVKRAHVSYKTFYKHFASKEECFIALFESTFATTERAIRDRLAAEPGEWSDQVVLALRTLVEQILEDPVIARAVIVESPTAGPALTERYEQATRAFAPLLRGGREFNPRGAELPDTIEEALAGSVIWSAYEHLMVNRPDELAAYLPVLLELILRTYIGPAEAARIARAEMQARQPALA
jgi:AcrR family transcriptional regulator